MLKRSLLSRFTKRYTPKQNRVLTITNGCDRKTQAALSILPTLKPVCAHAMRTGDGRSKD